MWSDKAEPADSRPKASCATWMQDTHKTQPQAGLLRSLNEASGEDGADPGWSTHPLSPFLTASEQ